MRYKKEAAVYDASDPIQVKKKANLLKVTETIKTDAIREVMRSRSGRTWVHSLLEACHVWRSSFAIEPLAMAFAEGERNIGLKITAEVIEAAPIEYATMLREAEEPIELERLKLGEEDGRTDSGNGSTA